MNNENEYRNGVGARMKAVRGVILALKLGRTTATIQHYLQKAFVCFGPGIHKILKVRVSMKEYPTFTIFGKIRCFFGVSRVFHKKDQFHRKL